MRRVFSIASIVAALAVLALAITARRSDGQSSGPDKLTIAIYTPTVQFANSAARLTYIQAVAKAVASNTGLRVEGLSFTSLSQLLRARPHFAIVEAQCYADNLGWLLLANARIDGSTNRAWGLYSSLDGGFQALRGKKLAVVEMDCDDKDFIENAMLDGEVGLELFGGLVSKTDLAGAVAEVATYQGAQAVFAPAGTQRGLAKIFDAGSVPNPAFVRLDSDLSAALTAQVREAITKLGVGGAIDGWAEADMRPYRELKMQMSRRSKQGLFAAPEPVQVDADDVLIQPSSLGDSAFPGLRQHLARPPERQE